MFENNGIVIGLSKKVNKYKMIVGKLIAKEDLTPDEKEFLEKEGIGFKV